MSLHQPLRSGVSHYDRLGLSPVASAAEVREAYRRKARAAHPDLNGEFAHDQMAEINEAWRVLRDPELRKDYDELLAFLVDVEQRVASAFPLTANRIERPSRRFRWKLLIGAQVVAALVAVLIVAVNHGTQVVRGDVGTGDCVRLAADGSYDAVGCSEAHNAVVAVVLHFGQSCPESMTPIRSRTGRLCTVADPPTDAKP